MKGRLCSYLISMHIMSLVFATTWPFAACKGGARAEDTGYLFHTPPAQPPEFYESKLGLESTERLRRSGEAYNGLSTLIGSRPPNCERKCRSCKPCYAIQVPTTTDHFGVQYANYEPEGWKCKCGSSFFDP